MTEEVNLLGLHFNLEELRRQKKNAYDEFVRCAGRDNYATKFWRTEMVELQAEIEKTMKTILEIEKE